MDHPVEFFTGLDAEDVRTLSEGFIDGDCFTSLQRATDQAGGPDSSRPRADDDDTLVGQGGSQVADGRQDAADDNRG